MLHQHGQHNIRLYIFLIKVISQPWADIPQVISLCNVGPDRWIQTKLQIIFLCKVVWAVGINTAQVILLCNVGAGRSKQHCIGYFPAKTCLHALDQHWHCTSNFLVQRCLRCRTILTRQYSYAMLSQHGQYNNVQVIFLIKGVCLPWTNILHTQVISFLCNVGPERSGQYCRLFSSAKLFVDCAMIGAGG